MGKHLKKALLCCAGLLLALVLSGCSLESSVENLFTLPKVPIEYTELAKRIEALLSNGYEYTSPVSGSNIQSVQMVDLNGDGDEEAVAFFRRAGDEKSLKIALFRAEGESFEPICTIESGGTSVDLVDYRDFNGDGRLELVVGWRISADVQSVAVYEITQGEALVMMQSSYARFLLDDLDGNGSFDILLLRADEQGRSVAEHYRWGEGALSLYGSCHLSSTLAEIGRGSFLCGRLDGQTKAAFITGVNDLGQAITDILVCRGSDLSNITADPGSGLSSVTYLYGQLRPQDINSDGLIEIPFPTTWDANRQSGFFSWHRFDSQNNSIWVVDTYHNLSAGWYLVMNEAWHGKLTSVALDAGSGENQVSIIVDGKVAMNLYTLTGDEREHLAARSERTVLTRRAEAVYAAEILPAGEELGINTEWISSHFSLITAFWSLEN